MERNTNRKQESNSNDRGLELSDFLDEITPFEDAETQEEDNAELETYGLLHDCYIFPFMSEYVNYIVVASSIQAATRLTKERKDNRAQNIVINWYGGRHHCKKNKAAGLLLYK